MEETNCTDQQEGFKAFKEWDPSQAVEDPVMDAAKKAFGINYLYPWQRIVIENILDGCRKSPADALANPSAELNPTDTEKSLQQEDDRALYRGRQIVLLPTGAGKSLCFLTPAILLPGATMVLYPLLALMSDQKRRMDEGGITSVVFRGGQSNEEREENFRKIADGAKIILANPEVLASESLLERLSRCNISHIAIDEAHCVSEWGDSFRPVYLELGRIIKKLNPPAVTAFTATASPSVLSRVSEVLFGGDVHIVRSDSDRPNIHYRVVNAYAKKRAAFILALTERKPLIIFCGTRKKSEDMARELSAYLGPDRVRFYHAGLEREEKDAVEKWFYPKTDAVLCCTCAFGMGVDKKDIHTVIHLEPSPTAESYIQEAGRGGRDGSVADAILLWSPADSMRAKEFPQGSRERVLKEFAESTTCRRQVLLDALGGEQAACDGCDVCQRGGPAPFASDAEQVLSLVRKFPNRFTRDDLAYESTRIFNKKNAVLHPVSFYEHSDSEEIINQLIGQNMILQGKMFFRGLMKFNRRKNSSHCPGR